MVIFHYKTNIARRRQTKGISGCSEAEDEIAENRRDLSQDQLEQVMLTPAGCCEPTWSVPQFHIISPSERSSPCVCMLHAFTMLTVCSRPHRAEIMGEIHSMDAVSVNRSFPLLLTIHMFSGASKMSNTSAVCAPLLGSARQLPRRNSQGNSSAWKLVAKLNLSVNCEAPQHKCDWR